MQRQAQLRRQEQQRRLHRAAAVQHAAQAHRVLLQPERPRAIHPQRVQRGLPHARAAHQRQLQADRRQAAPAAAPRERVEARVGRR
eukprot:scaffold67921_cov70-Phaeocystis_antarctica.AAC.2